MKYFVILSEGAYSEYSPEYWMGDIEITQEEFDKKGKEIGDLVIEEFNKLPARKHTCDRGNREYCFHYYSYDNGYVRFDPLTNKEYSRPPQSRWQEKIEAWLTEKGYSKLPCDIPEINCHYDFPFSTKN